MPIAPRRFLRSLCSLALAASLPMAWASDPYPTKPASIVVAYGPGGQGDVFARLVAERLKNSLKQF